MANSDKNTPPITHRTVICGHRGGGGDPDSLHNLLRNHDFLSLEKTLDHYDYRNIWANRLPTFEYMFERGISCFELDLMLSKDREIVVVHDSIIDEKHVWEWGMEALQQKGCMRLQDLLNSMGCL